MQSFPGFAERAEAAFGSSALGRSAGAWRVSDTVARFAAGRASDSEGSEEQGGECDDGDGVGLAFCKAFEAEPEEAADDVVARADSSPPHHNELIDDTERPGRTVYVLDEPIYVGSGSRGDERGARQHAAALEHDAAEARGGSAAEPAAPAERPPQEPVKFHAREGVKRRRSGSPAPAKPVVANLPSTADDADAVGEDEEADARAVAPPAGLRKARKLRRKPREEDDEADA